MFYFFHNTKLSFYFVGLFKASSSNNKYNNTNKTAAGIINRRRGLTNAFSSGSVNILLFYHFIILHYFLERFIFWFPLVLNHQSDEFWKTGCTVGKLLP